MTALIDPLAVAAGAGPGDITITHGEYAVFSSAVKEPDAPGSASLKDVDLAGHRILLHVRAAPEQTGAPLISKTSNVGTEVAFRAQVDLVTIAELSAGNVASAGDAFRSVVDGNTYEVLAAGGESPSDIAAALAAAVDADPNVDAVAVDDAFTVTASSAGTPFTLSTETTSITLSISSSRTTESGFRVFFYAADTEAIGPGVYAYDVWLEEIATMLAAPMVTSSRFIVAERVTIVP